jgi:aldehyde dehydrogenase (NAD+)
VFVYVTNDMTIAQEEIFGPVLCVIAYETEKEAIRIANDTRFGLHAFVSGTGLQRARRVASQILAGRVAINGSKRPNVSLYRGYSLRGVHEREGPGALNGAAHA